MRTPCQIDPESWVGKDERQRAFAARICVTECPAFAQCKAGDFPFVKPGPDDHGVWAGIDYTLTANQRATANEPIVIQPNVKECLTCHVQIRRDKQNAASWEQVRYCSRQCYGASMLIPGQPTVKQCELCGADFEKGGREGKKWLAARFCGVACAGKARRKVRAA